MNGTDPTPAPSRGGRPRVNATPLMIRPRPDLLAAIDAARQDGESRPAAVDRLLRKALRVK